MVLVAGTASVSAQNAAPERSLASQVGRSAAKVVSGIHKGSLIGVHTPGDPLGMMGAFQLDYALWTLLAEPVEDYLFRWELGHEVRLSASEKMTLDQIKQEAPDQYQRLKALAPVSVTLRGRLNFFDSETTPLSFASAELVITPDLTAPSGKPQPFSVPGSPEWGAWLSNVKLGNNLVGATTREGKFELTSLCGLSEMAGDETCVKKIWARAKRVVLASASVVGVEWPDTEARRILSEISDRRRRVEQKARDRAASDDEFWSTPTPAPSSRAALRNDIPTKTATPTARPLDKNAREARQKRFAALNRRLLTVSLSEVRGCRDFDVIVDVDARLGGPAPVLVWDGGRDTGRREATENGVRYRYPFLFNAGGGGSFVITQEGSEKMTWPRRLQCNKSRCACSIEE
jgi:hypothetical protein